VNELSTASDAELMRVLKNSFYPGAKDESIKLVREYCRAAGLDPMQKPVHIVPMPVGTGVKGKDGWEIKEMRDVIMPGIGLYRTQAARSGEYAGVSEPEYGPDITETLGECQITYPLWCRVTVKRMLPGGRVAEFTATERWKENCATKSSKSVEPNAMWKKRPYGQIAKCTEAQALRKAFPELGAQPTAEEMEGKSFIDGEIDTHERPRRQSGAEVAAIANQVPAEVEESEARKNLVADLELVAKEQGTDAYAAAWKALGKDGRQMVGSPEHERLRALACQCVASEDVPQ